MSNFVEQDRKGSRKSGWIDKVDNFLGIFSPVWALRRRAAREAIHLFSSYNAASKDRLWSGWKPGSGSADEDLLSELPDIRDRSRELNRNDAHASSITNTILNNCVGVGLKPQSKILAAGVDISAEQITEVQHRAEYAWRKWVPQADAAGKLDFNEMQELVFRQILENGEAIILPLMLDEEWRYYHLALEVVEADRLETPSYGRRRARDVRSGVEIGRRGEPMAYWIKRTHPGDTKSRGYQTGDYVRIPARNEFGRLNVLHLYHQKRPGQTRGIPFFAPAMTLFKDMASYMEAELVSARVAACFSVFVTTENPLERAMAQSGGKQDSRQNRTESIEPGMIDYLSPGEDIKGFSPNRPGGTFDPFIERILRSIGAALDLPYELLAKDFSKTNYSSARASLLEARRFFRYRQDWIAKKLCQPIWEMVQEEADLRGELGVRDFGKHQYEYTRARWIAGPWGWVDPVKEVMASRKALEGNLTTLSDEAAAQGYDWEELLEQRSKEIEYAKELGIYVETNPAAPAAPAAPVKKS